MFSKLILSKFLSKSYFDKKNNYLILCYNIINNDKYNNNINKYNSHYDNFK